MAFLKKGFEIVVQGKFSLECVSRCEKSTRLQECLSERSPGCVFQNIMDRVGDFDVPYSIDGSIDVDALKRIVQSHGTLAKFAHCTVHRRTCRVPCGIDMDISGSPCRPWSRANRINRGHRHPDVRFFIAWCIVVRRDRPPLCIHENVLGFDTDLLSALLGDLYEIIYIKVFPEHAGFHFIARPRMYALLALRGRVRLVNTQDMYTKICQRLRGEPTDKWLDWVWQAPTHELLVEENEARALRKLPMLGDDDSPSRDWTFLLTPKQQDVLKVFHDTFSRKCGKAASEERGSIVDLSQSVTFFSRRWPNRQLPTIRRGSRRFWSAFHRRWFTPLELASCMGFAIYPDAAAATAVEVDDLTRSVATSTAAVGNCMHVGNVGVVMAVAMATAEWAPQTSG